VLRWDTVINDNTVSEVGGHDEIVLNDEGSLLSVENETLDNLGGNDTLLGVEVSRGLVDQIDIGRLAEAENKSKTLELTTRESLNLLIQQRLDFHGLGNISHELRVHPSVLDLGVEQLANRAVEGGRDLLRLVGHIELGNLVTLVRLELSGKHTDKSGLTSSVLTQQNDDFRVSELTSANLEGEVALNLLHVTIRVATVTIVLANAVDGVNNLEGQGELTETQVFGGDETSQENVDTLTNREGKGDDTINSGLTVENADEVGQVIQNGQIVLDNNNILLTNGDILVSEETADGASGVETLLNVEVRGRLVEHIDVGLLDANNSNSETLQFTTRKSLDITVQNGAELEGLNQLLLIVTLVLGIENLVDGTLNGTRDMIDVLGLDHRLNNETNIRHQKMSCNFDFSTENREYLDVVVTEEEKKSRVPQHGLEMAVCRM
jgi:hypothetical protein